MNVFNFTTEICEGKRDWNKFTEEDKKGWNTFMVHRILSMSKDYIEFVNEFQKYQSLTPEQIYTVYCKVIPRKKIWLKFIKPANKEINKELVKLISTYFECSSEEAKVNLKLLSKDQINDILSDYGLDSKTIKKLIK